MVTNVNKYEGLGFKMVLDRLPEVEFFCRSVNIPSVSSNPVNRPSQIKVIPEHGDTIVYAPLDVTFFIDENFINYTEVLNWIKSYTTPDRLTDYLSNSLTQQTGLLRSDLTISVLTAKNNSLKDFTFTDAFPTDLSSINIEANQDNVPYMLCSATFQYVSFNID